MFWKKRAGVLKASGDEPIFTIEARPRAVTLPEFKDAREVNVRYPLLPPYAYAHIFWDTENKELVYVVEEPILTEDDRKVLSFLEDGIKELINISFISVKEGETVIRYLEKNINVLLSELGIKISTESYLKIMYYIYRDFVGMNEIEPFLADYYVEDVECNGANSPIYLVHRKYRNVRTNVIFTSGSKLSNMVEKLAQKCGKYISYANPLLDGSLPDGSRVNATYATDVSSKGPTFTIRKFTKEPWTPTRLIEMGTLSPEILAYLWLTIEYESNIMIIGGTASGKTTLLNALAFFIPPQARVVSIEDTRELNLHHENWLPSVAREGIGLAGREGNKYGEVSLFDLLKESFRQNPDYVIVGEVRGAEAYVLFQGAASIPGDERIMVLNDEHPKLIPIKDLRDDVKYKVITIDPKSEKVKILPVKFKVTHPPRKDLLKILTKTGREIVTTPDHSLFSYRDNLISINADELKKGDIIVLPGRLPSGYADLDHMNLLEYLPDIRIYSPEYIKLASHKLGYDKSSRICNIKSITDYYSNFTRHRPASMKSETFLRLMKEADIDFDLDKIRVNYTNNRNALPAKLEVTKEFLGLLGYYISEGSLDTSGRNSRIGLYNKDEKILEHMRHCIKTVTGSKPRERYIDRGYGTCFELSFSHKILTEFIKRYCSRKENKRVPDFIFGLSKEKIGHFLSTLYAGDGAFTDNYIGYFTTSKQLASGVAQLLLVYGIVASIRNRLRNGRSKRNYEVLFYSRKNREEFVKYVKPIDKNIIFSKPAGKNYQKLKNDLYLDKVKSIEYLTLKKSEPVYDISVPGSQNFIGGFGGVMLHNSGHPSFSTMHANSVGTMIRRLETPPINLSASLVNSLDVVCVMTQTKLGGKEVRRLREVDEIVDVKEGIGNYTINVPFIWDARNDRFYYKTESHIFNKLYVHYGVTKGELEREFMLRAKLLFEVTKQKIFGFREVQEIINAYYKTPQTVLKKFGVI